jgi:glucokinase
MLLAGDVGGTKSLLGLFEPGERRPRPIVVESYPTQDHPDFISILDAFERDAGRPLHPRAAAFGVAGPVVGGVARLTNIAWDISAAQISKRLGLGQVALLNDLAAMATSVPALRDDELYVLQDGEPRGDGHAAVIAAGTGLGQALLHRVDGFLRPAPSEGGHADYAARTDRELDLVRMLRDRYGRAEVEQVISGPGLINLHRFTHRGMECQFVEEPEAPDAPAQISAAGMTGRCQFCAEALRMFVDAYGAEAGNVALRGMATSGVFLGGGIAPKILPALENGRFMAAFRAKPPMDALLARIPVKVIMNADAGLLGAALHAQRVDERDPRARTS